MPQLGRQCRATSSEAVNRRASRGPPHVTARPGGSRETSELGDAVLGGYALA